MLVIDHDLKVVDSAQKEHEQICTKPGWCEHDPMEIYNNVLECLNQVIQKNGLGEHGKVRAIGITNQRETTVAFDRTTGQPLSNAIVWLDKRTDVIVHEMNNTHSKED